MVIKYFDYLFGHEHNNKYWMGQFVVGGQIAKCNNLRFLYLRSFPRQLLFSNICIEKIRHSTVTGGSDLMRINTGQE